MKSFWTSITAAGGLAAAALLVPSLARADHGRNPGYAGYYGGYAQHAPAHRHGPSCGHSYHGGGYGHQAPGYSYGHGYGYQPKRGHAHGHWRKRHHRKHHRHARRWWHPY